MLINNLTKFLTIKKEISAVSKLKNKDWLATKMTKAVITSLPIFTI